MYEIMCKTIFKEKFMCAPSFLVCANLMTCVRAHTNAHSLEGSTDHKHFSQIELRFGK